MQKITITLESIQNSGTEDGIISNIRGTYDVAEDVRGIAFATAKVINPPDLLSHRDANRILSGQTPMDSCIVTVDGVKVYEIYYQRDDERFVKVEETAGADVNLGKNAKVVVVSNDGFLREIFTYYGGVEITLEKKGEEPVKKGATSE